KEAYTPPPTIITDFFSLEGESSSVAESGWIRRKRRTVRLFFRALFMVWALSGAVVYRCNL
ncbi:MAG: hypothetical protein ACI9YB_003113, partial [Halioglobus sp.]